MPLPIGLFDFVDKFNKDINVELQIKSKWGVSPFIKHPKAMKPSYLSIFLDIVTGIS